MKNLSELGCAIFVVVFLPLVGLFLIYAGLWGQAIDERFVREGLTTQATITKKFESKGVHDPSQKTYSPSSYWIDFSFRDEKGRYFKSDSIISDSFYNELAVGNHLTVKYLKSSPGTNEIVDDSENLEEIMPSLFITGGAGLVASPIFYYIVLPVWIKKLKPAGK